MTGRLRELDDAWVPTAAGRLRGLLAQVRRAAGPGNTFGRTVTRVVHDEPALAGSVAAVLLAGVLIASVGESAVEQPGGRNAGVVLPTTPPALVATIGPAPGASVATYLTRAGYDLRHYGEIAAGRPTYAVVDLRRYASVAEATTTFDGATVVRAYVRVPSRLPTEVRSVPVNGLQDLSGGITKAAQVAAATAKSYGALLATFHPQSHADRVTRARYALQRRAARLEAARLARPATCRCIFAVVVLADIQRLAALSRIAAVRVVDPASPVIPIAGLTVRPLLPEATTAVPRTGLLGG
ncbi:MAG: hypothetical protein QOF18_1405 [Frankiaceae bacterium]|nr:hypothetical protein [Frankiaceae bacterium]